MSRHAFFDQAPPARSDLAEDDALLEDERRERYAAANAAPQRCRTLTHPGDLCSTCWTEHTNTPNKENTQP